MRKDPTQFRERFKRWKAGEQVYSAGLPAYNDGKSSNILTQSVLERPEGWYDDAKEQINNQYSTGIYDRAQSGIGFYNDNSGDIHGIMPEITITPNSGYKSTGHDRYQNDMFLLDQDATNYINNRQRTTTNKAAVALSPLVAAPVAPQIWTAINNPFVNAAMGIKSGSDLVSDDGVIKTIRSFGNGEYANGSLSLLGDLFDVLGVYQGAKGFVDIANMGKTLIPDVSKLNTSDYVPYFINDSHNLLMPQAIKLKRKLGNNNLSWDKAQSIIKERNLERDLTDQLAEAQNSGKSIFDFVDEHPEMVSDTYNARSHFFNKPFTDFEETAEDGVDFLMEDVIPRMVRASKDVGEYSKVDLFPDRLHGTVFNPMLLDKLKINKIRIPFQRYGGWASGNDVYINPASRDIFKTIVHEGHHAARNRIMERIRERMPGLFADRTIHGEQWPDDLSARSAYEAEGLGYTGKEVKYLDDAYVFDDRYLEANPWISPISEKGATNSEIRAHLSENGRYVGKALDEIIDKLSYGKFRRICMNINAYGDSFIRHVQKQMAGMTKIERSVYQEELMKKVRAALKYVGVSTATAPLIMQNENNAQ